MKKLIIAACLLLLPITSFAGFKFNPKVNYNLLEYNSNDATGVGFGLGLGYSFIGLYTMLEYEAAELSLDGSSSDKTMRNMGLVLGYEFPILLNVWINYVFDAEIGSDEGSGTKLGLGNSSWSQGPRTYTVLSSSYGTLAHVVIVPELRDAM